MFNKESNNNRHVRVKMFTCLRAVKNRTKRIVTTKTLNFGNKSCIITYISAKIDDKRNHQTEQWKSPEWVLPLKQRCCFTSTSFFQFVSTCAVRTEIDESGENVTPDNFPRKMKHSQE